MCIHAATVNRIAEFGVRGGIAFPEPYMIAYVKSGFTYFGYR